MLRNITIDIILKQPLKCITSHLQFKIIESMFMYEY